ncbi:MAG TPA: hypothetical protein VMS22_14685 [Candidatus Eisenbacteria bacterium]|nr:hypothetical protein [Candidatus Eisenbacteria bacterium]
MTNIVGAQANARLQRPALLRRRYAAEIQGGHSMGLSAIAVRMILAGMSLLPFGCSRTDERVPVTSIQMENVAEAVRSYTAEFGGPPAGDSEAIIRALRGENPRGLRFLQSRTGEKAAELLDPWGTSYDVAVVAGASVRVRSAGPNRTLGDGDDREINERLERGAS